MKTLVSILLSASALTAAAFAIATPASAASYGYYDDDDVSVYREYCRDPGYRERYAYYCNQFYDDADDDDDYDDNDYYDNSYSTYPSYGGYYPNSSYSYPYSDSYYPNSYYPYSYGPSIGFSFGFNNHDRRHRYYGRHWRH